MPKRHVRIPHVWQSVFWTPGRSLGTLAPRSPRGSLSKSAKCWLYKVMSQALCNGLELLSVGFWDKSDFESCCSTMSGKHGEATARLGKDISGCCNVLGSVLNGLLSLRFQLVPADQCKSRIVRCPFAMTWVAIVAYDVTIICAIESDVFINSNVCHSFLQRCPGIL